MRVENRSPVGQVPVSEPPPQMNATPPSPYRDALVSFGKRAGWAILSRFYSALRRGIYFGLSFLPKKQVDIKSISEADLLDIDKFLNRFETDPFSVIMNIVILLNNDPKAAEEILVKLAHHCQDNLQVYSAYGGGIKQQLEKRKDWILKVNELVTKCLLTPRQREIVRKNEDITFTDAEGVVMNYPEKDWRDLNSWWRVIQFWREPEFTLEVMQFRTDYREGKARMEQFNQLWETVLFQLEGSGNFNDLALNDISTDNNPFREKSVTFGGFIERLLLVTDGEESTLKLSNLKDKKNFAYCATYSLELITFILTDKTIPPLPPLIMLCEKMKAILENDEKRAAFHLIVSRVVAIFRPNE